MDKDNTLYSARGVSSRKEDVHAVVGKLNPGIFPSAFCKVTPDFLTGDPHKCNVIHADGSGTKSIIAYLHFKETGDVSVFRGIAIDSIVMNLDDLICVGALQDILISSTINRNARHIPGAVLSELILGTEAFLEKIRQLGVSITSGGGETADLGDLVRTVVVDSCAVAVLPRSQVIDASKILPGLAIVGLSSTGRATYEDVENSGIGSNGLTSARHDLLNQSYAKKYPEIMDPQMASAVAYVGPYQLDDVLPETDFTIGRALLSPTRTYAPVIARILQEYPGLINGIIHCSGGGQTKCLRFGQGVHFVKDNLFPVPPLFQAIQKKGQTPAREMYETFNMGHRMEVYCKPENVQKVIEASQSFGIEAQVVGRTEALPAGKRKNYLTLQAGNVNYEYC